MRRFFLRFFAAIGALTVLIFLIFAWSVYQLSPSTSTVASNDSDVVLCLTLGDQTLAEQPSSRGLSSLIHGQSISTYSIIEGLHHAAKDKRIKGVFLSLEGSNLNIATAQEIREALKVFKATGKFVYTYADTFGELSNGTKNYYLASLSTKIWMMPLGTLNTVGIMIEVPFAKKLLEKAKIHPQMGRREEYKGFVESLIETDFTPPYKANMQRVIDNLSAQIISEIAADRGLEVAEVQKIFNTSPLLVAQAQEAKMIDAIGYKDQVKESIENHIGKKPKYVSFDSYSRLIKPPSTKEQIAIVYAEGVISKGKGGRNPFSEESVMNAAEVAKSIHDAAEDKDIKAIVLRIDSGGGSAIASELIGHEIERAKTKKPIIASMSNYAASGGYLIACNATKIVAQPTTVTGSIGVYGGKIVTEGFWENFGVHWGDIHNGNNAQIWSRGSPLSTHGWKKLNDYLDQIYILFQNKVAIGRKLPLKKVHEIAKGQIWTGTEAKEKGLIDALGGLNVALELAKNEVGLGTDAPITLVHLPAPKSFIELLFDTDRSDVGEILAHYPTLTTILKYLEILAPKPQIELKLNAPKP
ncbi:MAG: signal peptide peptidase SppA [Alphaproteobacteria bacterium]|nr:signal peptide peptidase SppA [Alphaproteobacteria bacterium]